MSDTTPLDDIDEHLEVALETVDSTEKKFHLRQAMQMLYAADPADGRRDGTV